MTKRIWNEDEIRAAWAKVSTTTESCDYDSFVAALPARTLRPDQPVICEGRVGPRADFKDARPETDFAVLFTEDQVMGIVSRALRNYCTPTMYNCVRDEVQAQLDAIKYRVSDE